MMTSKSFSREKLIFAEKFSRTRTRMNDPEWRRYGMLVLAGKALGIALLMLFIFNVTAWTGSTHALAAGAAPGTKASDIVNPLNPVWTLIAAFLVFGMQVGFTMLEAGFCRSRETVNVLMECIVDNR